ncbi:MAG: hypothetical protein LBT00_06255 [Spirochaetaceae bacterium]|jgi:hypothetical protein|nr:hypothetical protein [Spirochaetaceae bacterium]
MSLPIIFHYPFIIFNSCEARVGSWLTFSIKPNDGFKLPKIMQWLKQTFSLRFNLMTGRTRAWREWKMDN